MQLSKMGFVNIFDLFESQLELTFVCLLITTGQYFLSGYIVVMIILFVNYYQHEYVSKSNEKKRIRLNKIDSEADVKINGKGVENIKITKKKN
jgi:hypothetical protein